MTTNLNQFLIFSTIFSIAVDNSHSASLKKPQNSSSLEGVCSCVTLDYTVISFDDIITSSSTSELDTETCLPGNLNLSTSSLSYFESWYPTEGVITSLNLGYTSISTLPQNFFQQLDCLRNVSLGGNLLTTICKDVFSDHRTLEMIGLENNKISAIDDGAFGNMSSLRVLNMSGNRLKEFDPDWFRSTMNMTRLNFAFNQIVTLPEEAFRRMLNAEDAQEISFNDNKIGNLSSAIFRGLKNITFLALQNNEIEAWRDDFFEDEQYVKIVKLSNNKITCPEGNMEKVFNLWNINVCGNPLTEECIREIIMWKILRCSIQKHIPVVTDCLKN